MSTQTLAGSQVDKAGSEVEEDNQKEILKVETVSYDSHKKLMDQHKGLKGKLTDALSRLDVIEKEKETQEQNSLEEQNQWKEIAQKKGKELEAMTARNSETEKTMMDGMKLSAFVTSLPAGLKKDSYMQFIDLNKIVIDSENGGVDREALSEYTKEWVDEYGKDLLKIKGTNSFNGAPANNKGSLTHKQWLGLPNKERISRISEVKD